MASNTRCLTCECPGNCRLQDNACLCIAMHESSSQLLGPRSRVTSPTGPRQLVQLAKAHHLNP